MKRAALFLILAAVYLAAAPGRTTWSGVYSAEQAKRGAAVYTGACATCHKADLLGFDDDTGFASQLKGEMFMDHWLEDNLDSLYTRMKTSMPQTAPGSLDDSQYSDILAYILSQNEFPAGQTELTPASINGVRITTKEGPGPVPDGALVQISGCLLQSRQKTWIVYHATNAERTRETGAPTPEALKAAEQAPDGPHTYRLTDAETLKLQSRVGRKVVVRGFITWKKDDDQVSIVHLEQAGSARCN